MCSDYWSAKQEFLNTYRNYSLLMPNVQKGLTFDQAIKNRGVAEYIRMHMENEKYKKIIRGTFLR